MAGRRDGETQAIESGLSELAADLRRLEGEYNMFFAGRLPRPPSETRRRVETLLKRLEYGAFDTATQRFRFATLQARFGVFADLWDRAVRAREEGRPGPFARKPAERPSDESRADERVLHVASFTDPVKEIDRLEELYNSLMDARRSVGGDVVPFHKFAELIKGQVRKLQDAGSAEVAFRVGMREGKVTLTARGLRGA